MEGLQTLYSVFLNQEYQSHGVEIKGYHKYNGIFNTSEFMDKLLKKQQKIIFSEVCASHQNGAAECTTNMVEKFQGPC